MNYLLVDTCVLSDLMRQYNPCLPNVGFVEGVFLKKNMLRMINFVVQDMDSTSGYIVVSAFAFLELINKFCDIFKEEISKKTMSLDRIIATIQQPPSWLIIEETNLETAKEFCEVPNSIGTGEHISADDAVHIATALQRGDEITLLTTDHVLKKLNLQRISVVTD